MATQPLTLFPAIACLLILALLAFWLFGPTGEVAKELNAQGTVVQWIVAKFRAFFAWIGGLFSKKAPVVSPGPVNPPGPPTPSEAMDNLPVAYGSLAESHVLASGDGNSATVAIPGATVTSETPKQ